MKEAQARVRRFHEAMAQAGAHIGDFADPYIGRGDAANLRSRLQIEECIELCIALSGFDATRAMVLDALDKRRHEARDESMETIAREAADLTAITLGTVNACGIYLAPVFDEVMSANERKVGPGARVREDGKLLKPGGWVGPDVAAVLARQRGAKA
jgi:predicted HAD superfamily Cof-like phosphohydrolase